MKKIVIVKAPGQESLYLDGRLITESMQLSVKTVVERLMEEQIDLTEYNYVEEEISAETLEEFGWSFPKKLTNVTPYFL